MAIDLQTIHQFEAKWSQQWKDQKLFVAENPSKKPSFTILMPPPNVTSQLHMGHGTGYSFQDLLIRWKRMQGMNALWLSGTDHAGIATQMMVEKELLQKEGKKKEDLGREAFFARCEEWKDTYGDRIYEQFDKIGFSYDPSRKAYTMDAHLSQAVRYVFAKLFQDGLIYKGHRLINWDPALQTAISDDEIFNETRTSEMVSIAYSLVGSDETITIATTRPETLLGDTGIAVHPDDPRYQHLIGKKARVPLVNREIPILADDYVKMDFGTGALKITPAHDPNDFEVGLRHGLEKINIFDKKACILAEIYPDLGGVDRFEARKKIIKLLENDGALVERKKHKLNVPISDRSKQIVEPRLSEQWFVKIKPLANLALEEIQKNGAPRFFPDNWKKSYQYWLENIEDWCISRQLWWGHRIPIWTCGSCREIFTTENIDDPTQCNKCSSTEIEQEKDVLDTWFSSWLWPLSPLGWPDEKAMEEKGFERFFPSDVLLTGSEIIFLWVSRMVMASLYFKKTVPFKDVYFTAIVTDKKGQKFSKTLGNGIDPVEVIEEFGADAVRYTALSLAPLSGRIPMSKGDFELGSKFVNKLWNAFHYLEKVFTANPPALKKISELELQSVDAWLLQSTHEAIDKVNQCFAQYRIQEGLETIYHLFWSKLCDWSFELNKRQDAGSAAASNSVLLYCFDQVLRLLHPVTPFITEELWSKLPRHPSLSYRDFLCQSPFPVAGPDKKWEVGAALVNRWIELATCIRSTKQKAGLAVHEPCELKFQEGSVEEFKELKAYFPTLLKVSLSEKDFEPENSLPVLVKGIRAILYHPQFSRSDQKSRLQKEEKRLIGIVAGYKKKLDNPNFWQNAPAEILVETEHKCQAMEKQLADLQSELAFL